MIDYAFDINLDDDIFIGVTRRKHFEYEQELRVITTTTFSQDDNRRLILRDAAKELYKIEPFEQNRTNLLILSTNHFISLHHLCLDIFFFLLS
jgi:hypothetical protein